MSTMNGHDPEPCEGQTSEDLRAISSHPAKKPRPTTRARNTASKKADRIERAIATSGIPTRLPNRVTPSQDGAWMAPRSTTNRAKAAGVGASSFLDLKAELAAKEKEISENKAVGKKTTSGGQKPGKVNNSPLLFCSSFGEGRADVFSSSLFGRWSRNQPYGADLTRESTREPRGISSSKLSTDRRSKPRTRFWNESRGFTRTSTRGRMQGFQRSSTGRCLLM